MGTPKSVIQPMQKVQNTVAHLILRAPHHQNCTPLLQQLHWLPISEWIKYKTACMCYNTITGSAPSYISGLLHRNSPSSCLRSLSDMHAQTPALQPQNPWLSHFFTLWPPHLEQSPPRHQALCYSLFLQKIFLHEGQWPKWINHLYPYPYLFLQKQTQDVTFLFSEYFN